MNDPRLEEQHLRQLLVNLAKAATVTALLALAEAVAVLVYRTSEWESSIDVLREREVSSQWGLGLALSRGRMRAVARWTELHFQG